MDVPAVIVQLAPALARIAASYERDRALRDELLQEVLLAVTLALPRLQDDSKLKPFVFRIAHNRCVTHVAKQVRQRRLTEQIDALPAETASQEQVLIEAERGQRLLEAVRQLSLPYRQVITLVLEDLSYEEIAGILGISITNVGVRVSRARQQLGKLLSHE